MPAAASAFPNFAPCGSECDILVNSTADATDAKPGNGKCETAPGNGVCTLRAAVQEANASRQKPPYQASIKLPPGTYRLTRHGLDDSSDRGDLDLNFYGEVVGAGQSRTIVDGDAADRVFDLRRADERVAHLTVRNGRATDGPGGGIRAGGNDGLEYLNVSASEAVAGQAPFSGLGGGIAASDTWIAYSTISFNTARDGGGLWWHGAQAGFASDAIIQNHAAQGGGGMVFEADDAYFSNLTISGNTAGDRGGGIDLRGPNSFWFLDASASTIASNTAPDGRGGGLWRGAVGDSPRTFTGMVFARNQGGNCAGPGVLIKNGPNVDSDGSCSNTEGDVFGVDPMLGPVRYNGGPTPTRALLPGSPAIDMWPCAAERSSAPPTDQRGAVRPQGEACDAGAFEVGECCPAFEAAFHASAKGGGSSSGSGSGSTGPDRTYCGQVLTGTLGNDLLAGDERRNLIRGLAGDDRIFAGANADCVDAGSGSDLVVGDTGTDTIFGRSGNDRLSGGDDEDLLVGNSGNDRLKGGADEDRLVGSRGRDKISGGDGYDVIRGGPGNDSIDGRGRGLDTIDCGRGRDRVIARRGETLFRCEIVKLVD
jgi:CSLREA domain-containing protein